jgi:hypothetical protein
MLDILFEISLVQFIVYGLATWRWVNLLQREEGPKDILGKFRALIGVRYDRNNRPYGDRNFVQGFLCPWCLSPYIGAIYVGLHLFFPALTLLLALPFALSAASIWFGVRLAPPPPPGYPPPGYVPPGYPPAARPPQDSGV